MIDAGRDQLVASVLPLAHWLANKWARGRPQLADDLRQEACVALLKAATKFDPTREDANWPAFASRQIRWALLAFMSKQAEHRRRYPEARPIVDEDGTETQAVDLVPVDPDPRQDPARAAVAARARAAVAALPPRECRVVGLRYLSSGGYTLEAIGGRLGVTRERVRQIEVRGLGRLRGRLS